MRRLALGLALLAFAPHLAHAHFVLEAPLSWMTQDTYGSPQKGPPCGDEGGGAPTGQVTPFVAGQTITVTINEKIFHPGHYRIALATGARSTLPTEPVVTPGSSACGSAVIMSPAVYPVLADGVLAHTAPFSGSQSVQVTLPEGVTCDHCTLQVIEFMSDHALNVPGGCFYHHCADISIGDGTAVTDASAPADLGTIATPESSGCAIGGGLGLGSLGALPLLTLWALRRRRRR